MTNDTKDKEKNSRTRDDTSLRQEVSEARQWMRAHGVEEQPLNWEALARQERWRRRLRRALDAVSEGAEAVESAVTMALEVTLEAAAGVGRLVAESAAGCLPPDASQTFAYGAGAVKGSGGETLAPESAGYLMASNVPGARVVADAPARRVVMELLKPEPTLTVLLIPEDPSQPVRTATPDETGRVVFEDVADGRFLLSAVHMAAK